MNKSNPLPDEDWKEEVYQIIDSFLVEAKNQYGQDRTLERLNQDRHLAFERFNKLIQQEKEKTRKETYKDTLEVVDDLIKRGDDGDLVGLEDLREILIYSLQSQPNKEEEKGGK